MAFKEVILLSLVCVLASEAAVREDLITSLPGLSFKPNFKQYSGYVKATNKRQLHYWLVESQGNPAKDPLVLWLNGGPGCSSLEGLLNENGPFRVTDDGKRLNENKYAWNKIANVLYLEAPAEVGFSYSTEKEYIPTDNTTAEDNHMALKNFMSKFPEFAKNDFYITGESYGGFYVPLLSRRIVEDKDFNFKGFVVGNGLSDYSMNQNSLIYFANYHGLIGREIWTGIVAHCCKNGNESDCMFANNPHAQCNEHLQKVSTMMGGLNIYNLYAECYTEKNSSGVHSVVDPKHHYFPLTKETQKEFKKISSLPKEKQSEVPPCVNANGITTYLNTQAVRKALHIPDNVKTWSICNGQLAYRTQYNTMRSQYLDILSKKKYRIMLYNGDVDMACNYLGDEWFVNSLQQKQMSDWQHYTYKAEDGSTQIAGFYKKYQNISFVTVRGSGHMVPQDKPGPAFVLFQNFLTGKF